MVYPRPSVYKDKMKKVAISEHDIVISNQESGLTKSSKTFFSNKLVSYLESFINQACLGAQYENIGLWSFLYRPSVLDNYPRDLRGYSSSCTALALCL